LLLLLLLLLRDEKWLKVNNKSDTRRHFPPSSCLFFLSIFRFFEAFHLANNLYFAFCLAVLLNWPIAIGNSSKQFNSIKYFFVDCLSFVIQRQLLLLLLSIPLLLLSIVLCEICHTVMCILYYHYGQLSLQQRLICQLNYSKFQYKMAR